MGTTDSALKDTSPMREANLPMVAPGFGSLQSFELMQRAAKMLSNSTLVPTQYRAFKEIKDFGKVTGYEENPNAIPNCVIALNMSQRLNADPLMIMQNLYIVEGRPAWSAQFVAASINASGRFTPLRFELSEPGQIEDITYSATAWVNSKKETSQKTIQVQHRTCRAWALDKATGDRIYGPLVSMQMAIDEGWITKNGSKWQTMPEVMLHYRATSFFGKLHAPDLLMGLATVEEIHDIIETEKDIDGNYVAAAEPAKPAKASGKVASASDKAKAKMAEATADSQDANASQGDVGQSDAGQAKAGDLPFEPDQAKPSETANASQASFVAEMEQTEATPRTARQAYNVE